MTKSAKSKTSTASKNFGHPEATRIIESANDPLIQSFGSKSYIDGAVQSTALCWFIQVAIRLDLEAAPARYERHSVADIASGCYEIYEHQDTIYDLIQQHGILDENRLQEKNLSLYNFPTLWPFYDIPDERKLVKEPTLADLIGLAGRIADHVEQVPWADQFLEAIGQEKSTGEHRRDYLIGAIKNSRISDVLSAIELIDPSIPLVSSTRPGVQKKHAIEEYDDLLGVRGGGATGMYKDWHNLRILRFHDILTALLRDHAMIVNRDFMEALVFAHASGGATNGTVNIKSTESCHKRVFDFNGPEFGKLRKDAAKEINDMLKVPKLKTAGAQEIWNRWLPRTYPYNVPSFRRLAMMFPSRGPQFEEVVASFEPMLKLSVSERIQQSFSNSSARRPLVEIVFELAKKKHD
jgi:hypothetical protein